MLRPVSGLRSELPGLVEGRSLVIVWNAAMDWPRRSRPAGLKPKVL